MIDLKRINYKQIKLSFLLTTALGLLPIVISSKQVNAADKIRLVYGPFNCSLSVESLKTYADTGDITPEFKPYTKFINQQSLLQLRYWLKKDFDLDVVGMHKYTHSQQGQELLQEIGNVVTTHSERNGFYALRAALIKAATESKDWTVLDAIEQFPTENMQINTQELFKLKDFWEDSNISQQ